MQGASALITSDFICIPALIGDILEIRGCAVDPKLGWWDVCTDE